MSLPTLSQFLIHPPGFSLSTSLDEVAETLRHYAGDFYSHIILLDADQRPTGALALGRFWHQAFCLDHATPLDHLTPWVEPIMQVDSQQPLATVWPLPPPDTAPPVVVDDAMRYVGVVSPLAVLTWLSGQVTISDTHLTINPGDAVASGGNSPSSGLLEISHALKNPMTSLLGLSTLLLDARVGALNPRQTRYATLIQQVVRRLIGLINQILDWMRLDAGQLSVDIDTIPVQSFCQQTIDSYLSQLPPAQAQAPWVQRFTCHLPANPGALRADPLRLRLSLQWILDFYLQHQADPGGLDVEAWGPWLGLTLWAEGQSVSVVEALSDVGQPAPDAEPPARPHNLDHLGLMLARQFCYLQGGDLTYRLSGATSWITLLLPMAPVEETTPAASGTAKTRLGLLVCRQGATVDRVVLQLHHSDYRLAIARSITEAQGMMQRLHPAVVLGCRQSFPAGGDALRAVAHLMDPDEAPLVLELAPEPGANPGQESSRVVTLATLRPTLDHLKEAAGASPARPEWPSLTILLLSLSPSEPTRDPSPGLTPELRSWLQHYQCRLIQVEDLAQARVLTRVWQPDAILMNPGDSCEDKAWQALAQHPELVRLPLIQLVSNSSAPDPDLPGVRWHTCLITGYQPPQQVAARLIQTIATALKS